MIPIEQLTEQKLEERFYSLSPRLKEALDSSTNHDIILQIAKNHHLLDEERVLIVEQLTALVVLGFIHWYDVGKEINEALAFGNPKLAASIADEINVKIFGPIKADLESNYQPLVRLEPKPVVVSEIKKAEKLIQIDHGEEPLAPRPSPPPEKAPGEIPPAPFVIHRESAGVEPVKKSLDFPARFTPLQEAGHAAIPKEKKLLEIEGGPPPKPAQLEIGPQKEAPPGPPSRAPEPKVVHYSEFRTPLEPPPPLPKIPPPSRVPPPPPSLPSRAAGLLPSDLPKAPPSSSPPPQMPPESSPLFKISPPPAPRSSSSAHSPPPPPSTHLPPPPIASSWSESPHLTPAPPPPPAPPKEKQGEASSPILPSPDSEKQ